MLPIAGVALRLGMTGIRMVSRKFGGKPMLTKRQLKGWSKLKPRSSGLQRGIFLTRTGRKGATTPKRLKSVRETFLAKEPSPDVYKKFSKQKNWDAISVWSDKKSLKQEALTRLQLGRKVSKKGLPHIYITGRTKKDKILTSLLLGGMGIGPGKITPEGQKTGAKVLRFAGQVGARIKRRHFPRGNLKKTKTSLQRILLGLGKNGS